MTFTSGRIASAVAFCIAAGTSSAAMAQQPLGIIVRPVTAIVQAPFTIVGGIFAPRTTGTYNPEPARRAAVSYTPYDWAVVRPGVLKQTGPQYTNPAGADYSRPIVLRRGSTVPGYVNTAPVANISTPGMVPNARYDFFVSPEQRVVFLDTNSRQVVRIVR